MASPKFLDYQQAEHEQARTDPYLRAFVEYIAWERDNAQTAVLIDVRGRRFEEAFFKLAKADAMGSLVDRFFAEDAPVEAPDDEPEFVDPAMPKSERGK